MPGGLIQEDYQIEFGGALLGIDGYDIVSFDGLRMPDIRSSDVDRPQSDGQYAGLDYLSGRTFTIEVEIWFDRGRRAEFGEKLRAMQLAFAPGRLDDFVIQLPHLGKVVAECRVRRRYGPILNLEMAQGFPMMMIEFHSVDPRWYALGSVSDTAGLHAPSGGLTFPVTFPLLFGETSTAGGLVSAVNVGTYETFPTVTIGGPVTSPVVSNITSGQHLTFTGLTIEPGDELTIDFQARTALLNGTASRYGFIDDSRGWWALRPGLNEIRFDGVTTGEPTALIEWRSAYV